MGTPSVKIKRYDRLKMAGICVNCGKSPACNNIFCIDCSNKNLDRRKNNRQREAARSRKWYKDNIDTALERGRKRRRNNIEEIRRQKAIWAYRVKRSIFDHYSNGIIKCALCSEDRFGALTIDHIGGNGASHRKEIQCDGGSHFYAWLRSNNMPSGFRLLCMNCNHREFVRSIVRCGSQQSERVCAANLEIKQQFMLALGGKCVVCHIIDMNVLTCHHINNDGSEHRKKISNGKGGSRFYRAVLKSGDFSGLECRCFSCNCEAEWSSHTRYIV